MRSSRLVWLSIAVCLLGASACSKGDDDDDVNGGTGGALPGTGGIQPMGSGGTGGAVAGSGGMGVAGMGSGGMGVAGMGTGGMTAGTGGTGSGGMGSGGTGSGGTGSGGMGATFVPGSPTFSAIFAEIITGTGCNGGTLCHAGTVGLLTMNDKMATYTALVNVKAMGQNLPVGGKLPDVPNCKDVDITRVVPMDPDNSLLMKKISGTPPCGTPMPPSGGMLEAAKIEQIRTWIMNGAMND
jgi:hypothetical protein